MWDFVMDKSGALGQGRSANSLTNQKKNKTKIKAVMREPRTFQQTSFFSFLVSCFCPTPSN
jgi:hypothetical protein